MFQPYIFEQNFGIKCEGIIRIEFYLFTIIVKKYYSTLPYIHICRYLPPTGGEQLNEVEY